MAVKASTQITISKVIDVYAVYRYYKLQASTLTKPTKPTKNPPDGWSDTEPAYVSGSTNTLYFVDCNVYSDNSFSFSEVSISSSYEAAKDAWNKANNAQNTANSANNKIDKLQIGGRNLVAYANLEQGGLNPINVKTNSTNRIRFKEPIDVVSGETYIITPYKFKNCIGIRCGFHTLTAKGEGIADSGWTQLKFGEPKTYTMPANAGKCAIVFSFSETSENASSSGSERTTTISAEDIQDFIIKFEKGNKATDWTPAPEDIITSVDVEYYLSTSATSLSGGSWSTTAPEWVNGKYMRSRTIKTDGVGNKSYSPNQNGVCIAGAQGNTGATGATGKGVKSIVEQYYKSTSATSLAGGSWGTTYPGWENGKYIWTRSVITYTDNTTTTTAGVCVTGTKGAQGDKGNTGATGLQALQPNRNWTGTFTTIGQTATADTKDFNRTPVVGDTFTNLDGASNTGTWQVTAISGTSVTVKLLSYVNSKGATGSAGKGVKSTVVTYQAGNSGTTVPTGTWTTTVPEATADKPYIWTRTVITYTDNTTSTMYAVGTTPEGISIGGRNLVKNSAFANGSRDKWANWNTPTTREIVSSNNKYWAHIVGSQKQFEGYQQDLKSGTVQYGDVLTFSIKAKGATENQVLTIGVHWKDSSNQILAQTWHNITLDTTEKVYTYTFSPIDKPTCCKLNLMIGVSSTTAIYEVYYTDIKLEKGNRASDWSPSPDDITDQLNQILRYDDTTITLGRTGSNMTLNLQNDNINIANDALSLMNIGIRQETSDGKTWDVAYLSADQILALSSVNDLRLTATQILSMVSFNGGITFDVQSYQGQGLPIKFYKGVNFSDTANFSAGFTFAIPTRSDGDCNSITTSGKYYIGNNGKNRPEATNGWLECMKYSTNYCAQTYTTYNGKKYTRYQQNGSWGKWGRVWQSYQLFANEGGAMNVAIKLSASAADYDMLEIFYKSNDAAQNSVKVYSPNGKLVSLTSTSYLAGSTNNMIVKSKMVKINGTTIDTYKPNDTYGYWTGEGTLFNGKASSTKGADNVGIIRVLGWR